MKTVTGFFMAWGNFCAIPCPCKKWDEKARTHMLVMFPIIGLMMGLLWSALFWAVLFLELPVPVSAALLTAYHNAGGDIDLSDALMEMLRRGKSVPGGACGFWGACGAGISTGMFVSIISGSTPLTDEPFALSHKMTAALGQIGEIGGPRCCKRDSFLSILTAIDFVKEHFGIALQKPEVVCRYAAQNNQCIGKRCPFSAANRTAK